MILNFISNEITRGSDRRERPLVHVFKRDKSFIMHVFGLRVKLMNQNKKMILFKFLRYINLKIVEEV